MMIFIMYIFQENRLSNEQCVSDLGNFLGSNLLKVITDKSVNGFIQKFNHLMASIGYCESYTKCKSFKISGMTLFGCVLWDFGDSDVKNVFTTPGTLLQLIITS